MKRPLAVLLFVSFVCFVVNSGARADEVPHLEFVRGLRERHYPDLALEYLDKLGRSNPPADIAVVIPLELAKVHLALAGDEADGGRRLELYNKARAEFQQFIDKNPNHPLVGDARLEMARVTVLQGKAQLSKALLQDDKAARLAESQRARDLFVQANGQLQAVADLLDAQARSASEPRTKRALEQAHLQARLDLGLNYIDQAQTYLDEGKNEVLLERAKVIAKALPILEKLAAGTDAANPIAWQARAWVGYCYSQNGDTTQATRKLDEVAARTEAAAAAGRRLALFFQVAILLDPQARGSGDAKTLAQVRKIAEGWLADYRGFVNTPEGCGVRYYLADALARQAPETTDRVERQQQLTRARTLCRDLTRFENDYSEKARALSIRIIGAEGGFERDIAKLPGFEDCLARAEYEALRSDEFARKKDATPEAVEKERGARIGNAIRALRLALDFAGKPGSRVPPADVNKARAMLCGYYLFTGKYQEAIDAGEPAARAAPPTAQSGRAAMYVLEAYNDSISQSLRDGTATLADLSEKGGPIERMTDLARMAEQRWPGEQPGDVARHLRGLLLVRQKKEPEAVAVLSRVSANYPALIFVKYQLATAAFQAAQDRAAQARAESDKGRKEQFARDEAQFNKQAVEALKAVPALPPGADALTTGVYLQAKIELARALYRAREFAEIDKLVGPLLDGFDKGQFHMDTPEHLKEARANLVLLKLYGRYGAADAEMSAGHPDKVKEITDPVVEAIRAGKYEELKANPALRWGLMGLALRVSIQQGNTARAQEILQAVQKFATQDEGEGGGRAVLTQLALMVKDQVRAVRRKNDKELLKKTVENFSAFLDELSRGQQAPSPEFLRILAEAYAAVDRHDKAIELARKVPDPAGEDARDARKAGNYHFCRLLVVRELRLDGKTDQARDELARIKATDWGKDNPEARKEEIHLLGVTAPGRAYVEWSKLVGQLSQRFQQAGMKDQYFDCYYWMTDSWFRHAQALPPGQKHDDGVKRAATFIVKLEAAWPDLGGEESKARFTELLEREPALKEQYDKLKGEPK